MVGENGIYLLSMKETKFKHTEIGLIPEDWEVKSLVDATPLQRGFDLPKAEQQIGPYPVVYSNGICSYHNKFMIKGPGVVTGRSGTIGSVHYIESDYWPHNTTLWVTKFNGNYPLYVYYLFQTIDWKLYSTGSGVPTLNRNDVHEKLLPFPTYEEQSRIATALYDIDTLIRNLDRTIEKKKNIRQGAMEQLLSGKKRLPGFKGEWKRVEIGEICKRMKRGEVLSAADMNKGIFPVIAAGVEPAGYCDKYNRNPMTISISGSGANAGFIAFHKNRIFATDCFTISASDNYDVEFIYYVLKMRQKEIYKLQTGGAQPHVYPRDLSFLSVYYTEDIQEQRAIADTLTAMDDEIAVLQMERDKYANIRSGMMDDLLTGRKRL